MSSRGHSSFEWEKTVNEFALGLRICFRDYGWLLSSPRWKFLPWEYRNQVALQSISPKVTEIIIWHHFKFSLIHHPQDMIFFVYTRTLISIFFLIVNARNLVETKNSFYALSGVTFWFWSISGKLIAVPPVSCTFSMRMISWANLAWFHGVQNILEVPGESVDSFSSFEMRSGYIWSHHFFFLLPFTAHLNSYQWYFLINFLI